MKRRSFIKAMAAIAMAPLVELRATVDREALMLPFCGEMSRYATVRPFGVGSLTYATDGIRMVRGELANRHEIGEVRLPPVEKVWGELWVPTTEFMPIDRPAIEDLAVHDYGGVCPVCIGRQIFLGENYPSREEWEQFAADGLCYDVDENTVSDKSCPQCHGRDYFGPSLVMWQGHTFEFAMLAPMFNLPNVRVSLSRGGDSPRPLLFIADGFEGMVMPRLDGR